MPRLALLAPLFLLVLATPATAATTIRISETGEIRISNDQVLGESTKNQANQPKERVIQNGEAKQIKIAPHGSNGQLTIELEARERNRASSDFHQVERQETKQLKIERPQPLVKPDREALKQEITAETETLRQEGQQKQEELRAQAQQQRLEFRTLRDDITQEIKLELESRGIKARTRATFALDPATNTVTITTPSGQQKVLQHLPDKAIERMHAAGKFESINANEMEISTDNDQVIYKARAKKRKRLLGLIPRQVETEVVLNDTSGEVTETEVAPKNPVEQVLASLSI